MNRHLIKIIISYLTDLYYLNELTQNIAGIKYVMDVNKYYLRKYHYIRDNDKWYYEPEPYDLLSKMYLRVKISDLNINH